LPQAVKAAGPLKIVEALFEDYDGWPTPRLEVPAGRDVVLNFRMEGFERRSGKDAAGYPQDQVSLRYQVELRDPKDVLVAPAKHGQIETTLGPQDDQWRPLVRWSAPVPAWAPSGAYAIHIQVEDAIGEQRAELTVGFQVRGENIPPADTLQINHPEFARSDDGPWSSQRSFALRDPVYVRFQIVGFRVSSENKVWVEQDWTVLDAEGKVVISQPEALSDQVQNFYPPRFLATNFRLDLKDPKPGSYTLRITLRDRIGDQTASSDSQFNLRP